VTAFIVFCAALALSAIFVVAYPLLRPLPVTAPGESVVPRATPLAFALAVVIGTGAILLYAKVSNFPWNDPLSASSVPAGHGNAGDASSMDQVVAQLQARLAKQPNDAEGWRMLGRSYLITGNAPKAAEAYERAASLSSIKDPELQLDLAEALVLGGDPAAQARAKAIIAEALAADPNSQKALWYDGLLAAQAGDKATAEKDWRKLLEQNPPAEIREVIVNQLAGIGVTVAGAAPAMAAAAAPTGMGAPAASSAAMGGGVVPKGRTINITVKLDPALQARLKPGVPLFVSAREPGIPGPPIAAVRLLSDDLPATVTLSDANTMIEGRDLSSVNDVEVVARVALGGTVAVASGDLLGSAVHKKGGDDKLEVVIAKAQP
jgi:cytochrome c-type biogenesis protein CcmH